MYKKKQQQINEVLIENNFFYPKEQYIINKNN